MAVLFDGWMSDIWEVRDEQPIHPTSTHPCTKRAAGTQVREGVKLSSMFVSEYVLINISTVDSAM